jgi:hypothetical protein
LKPLYILIELAQGMLVVVSMDKPTKNFALICLSAFAVYCFYWISNGWKKDMGTLVLEESYEMQRPSDELVGIYDISNRKIKIRKVDENGNPIEENKSENQIAGENSQNVNAKTDGAKTAAPGTPNNNAKNAKTGNQAKNQNAKNSAKKPKLSVDVVGNNNNKMKADSAFDTKNNSTVKNTQPNTVNTYVEPTVANNEQTVNAEEEEESKLSPGQWFSILQNQPNRDNALKFLKAKNQVGNQAFYDITYKLLKDSQADRQKAALFILDQDVSLETYMFLVKTPEDLKKQESTGKQILATLKKYEDKSRFTILARALSVKDQQVVLYTQNVLLQIIQTNKPADVAATSTSGSRPTTNQLTKSDFYVFKLAISRLTTNSEPSIANSAKEIYSALWQGTIVADTPAK